MSFLEIFAPDLRHLREERERQKHMVAHPKYGGGAPLGIDLEAGTARILVPAPPEQGPTASDVGGRADEDTLTEPSPSQSVSGSGTE